jgi:hypothetical protein
MPTFKVYDFLCDTCQEKTEYLVNTSDPEWEKAKDCEKCRRGKCRRAPSGPPVQKASFVSGTKRAGFSELKEASKLEQIKVNLPPEKRQDVQREINKLKRTKK